MRPSWATNWVHFFSRSFSTFQVFPGAQLEKSQIIWVLWIPTSFFPSVLFHLYSLYQFLIFPISLPSLLFILKSVFLLWNVPKHFPACNFKVWFPHECTSTGRSWTNGIIPSPLKCSRFWGRALQPLCLQHVPWVSGEGMKGNLFTWKYLFLGKLNITWNQAWIPQLTLPPEHGLGLWPGMSDHSLDVFLLDL